jgi:excisionase family DNA binding protein
MKDTLTTTEAAKLLGFHVNTLKNWVRDGKMPAFKTLGGHYRIRIKDLVKVLRDNDIPVPSQLQMSKYTIVVIDDEPAFLTLIKACFKNHKESFEIKAFQNGYDALMEIGRQSPDLILMDIRLPHMDGYEFLTKLRQNEETKELKVIAVSGHDEERDRILQAGANDFYLKAQDINQLLEKMEILTNDKFLEFPKL